MTAINPQRGEVALPTADGALKMRLTLGALAELETRLDEGGLIALAERFEGGAFRADDLIAVIAAGLRGGGNQVDEAAVADMAFEGGAISAASAACALLERTFRAGQ